MPYDYQTGEEWNDGERVTLRALNIRTTTIDPQTGQMVYDGQTISGSSSRDSANLQTVENDSF
jgi:hypothetical protein